MPELIPLDQLRDLILTFRQATVQRAQTEAADAALTRAIQSPRCDLPITCTSACPAA